MHGEAARWQKRIRRELGDPGLLVRWNEEIERYEVGEVMRAGSSDYQNWFYVVTDGSNGFRPFDMRAVRKVRALDYSQQEAFNVEAIKRRMQDRKDEATQRTAVDRAAMLREELRTHRRARYAAKRRDV